MLNLTKDTFINKSKLIHGDRYDYSLVNANDLSSKIKLICPIHGIFEQSYQKHILLKRGCQKCGGSKKLTLEEFKEKAKKIHGDKYDYSLVEYKNYQTKVKIICPEHGVFEQLPNNHICKKYGCPSCSNNKKFDTSVFIEKAKKTHGDRYDYSFVEYKNAHTKVKIICKKHGLFEQISIEHIRGAGCYLCNVSKGERAICKILDEKKITYERQKRFNDCRNIKLLSFDFYLPHINTCIEYDGLQHFQMFNNFWGGNVALEANKKRDLIKNNYCKENNIKLFRIKYNDNIDKKIKQLI
jgi:hypothetical protein